MPCIFCQSQNIFYFYYQAIEFEIKRTEHREQERKQKDTAFESELAAVKDAGLSTQEVVK